MEECKKVTDLTNKELAQELKLTDEKIKNEYKIISTYRSRNQEIQEEILKRFEGGN
jgi:hypothetical protein